MARTSKSLASASGSKALSVLDAELNAEVAALKSAIGGPGGRTIKVKPAGNFVSPEGFDLGDEIQVVVVDFLSKNLFYSGPYIEGQVQAPDCYAAGKSIAEMAPDAESPNIQADSCSGCPLNQFGTGQNGKSKACKNTREIAVLLIDPNDPDAHNDPSAPLYTFSVSPSNIRAFDGAVAQIMRVLNGPPLKAVLTMTAKNVGTYASVSFVDPVPNPNYAEHAGRRVEAADLLTRKPDFSQRPQPVRAPTRQAPRRNNAAPARAASGRR